jgi:hypothetical protein
MRYRCHICNKEHDDLPDIGADYPDQWYAIPESERAARAKVSSDLCRIDNEHYFIRGVIEIPLIDAPGERFGFGVWVSQAKHNFETYVEHFKDASGIGPFFGWLCTRIKYYEALPEQIKTMAHFPSGDQRPLIRLEPADHALAVDQRDGIRLEKAWEIVHFYMKV